MLRFKQLRVGIHISLFMFGLSLLIGGATVLKVHRIQEPADVPEFQTPVRVNQLFVPDTPALTKQSQVHLVSKLETMLPVVFLTMDDGMYQEAQAVDYIRRRQWPVTLFLTDEFAKENYGYFKKLAQGGATVQNHTLSHPYLNDLTYEQQKAEVCAASDKVKEVFGNRPTLLRPPGGHYDQNTLVAATECGIDAVVMWSAKVDGGMVQFQRGDRLVPGDVVLMHFRPKIMEDLAAFETEIIKQGLYVARLEDWLRVDK